MTAEAIITSRDAAFGVARSFAGKFWILNDVPRAQADALSFAAPISPVLANILAARGVTADTLGDVLEPTLKRLLPEPNKMMNMQKAVARVAAALDARESIAVFGDYDVDGSASSALVSDFLNALGRKPRIYIPDRLSEGYGPSPAAMQTLAGEGITLVITVDCGAAAGAALKAARDAGIDVVVLDHHAVDVAPPDAFAQVNANQPGDESGLGQLCAAGVTFLFLVALNRHLREAGWYGANTIAEPDLRDGLDLVGLATICDVVPLTGVNRAFVRQGLIKLDAGLRPGLRALAAVARTQPPYAPYHLGFVLGPRINAGGRVGRCSLGAELLTAPSDEAAWPLAEQLDLHNSERKALEAQILETAMAMAGTQDNAPFLLAAEDGWHPGVVGIVAGRLKDRFGKPSFVAGFEGGQGRGSARSVGGVDIGAIVRRAREAGVIDTGGGHAMAAGFSLPAAKLDEFRAFLADSFANIGDALDAAAQLQIDAAISPSGATVELVDEIARAGPFGAGNPEPVMVAPDVEVAFADVVGKDHVRLRLTGGDGARLDAIAFRAVSAPLGQALLASRGKRIHAVGRLKADEWNGRRRVQLQIEDAGPANV